METEIGTPVQFYHWAQGMWWKKPATIIYIDGAKISILALGSSNEIFQDVKHYDFAKEGDNFWRHLPNKEGGEYSNVFTVEEFNAEKQLSEK